MNLTENEFLAYVAGIIDGEGCIQIHGETYSKLTLKITNTYKPLLDKLHEVFGGSVYSYPYNKYVYKDRYRRRAHYAWNLFGRKVEKLLPEVLPYLIVKKKHAEIVLEIYKNVLPQGSRPISPEELERRANLSKQLKLLNHKGKE